MCSSHCPSRRRAPGPLWRQWCLGLLLVLLGLPAFTWGQTQLINGNRVQAGWVNYDLTTGTSSAYVLTLTPALPGYVDGTCFLFRAHIANAGDATLNVNGKGAIALRKWSGGVAVPLSAGDIVAGQDVEACYDSSGTRMQVLSLGGGATGTGVTDGDKTDITVSGSGATWTIDPGAVTYAKMQATSVPSVLLGRGSASAGIPQEITLGSGLTMTGTSLSVSAGGGNVSSSGTPADNQVAVWTTASQIEGTSALTYTGGTLGIGAAGTLGKLTVAGNTSGVVTVQPQAAAGTYNFNLPTTAGAANQVLTSQGGGSAAMTWTTPGGVTDTNKGDITVSGGGAAWTINNSAVTYAKIQNVSPGQLLGRITGLAGPIEELDAAEVKTMLGYTFGDLPGMVPQAQLPNLNTLNTGLATTRCVETDGTGRLAATGGPCGVAGGAGDIASVGTCTTGDCFTLATPGATQWFTASTAPAAPGAGGAVWFDTTAQTLSVRTASAIKYMVLTKAVVANQFLTGLAADGTFSAAQPSAANLSDASTLLRTTGAQKVTGLQVVPRECALPVDGAGVTTINIDTCDDFVLNAAATNLVFSQPTGTGGNPACNQQFSIRAKTTAARTITHNAIFTAGGRITLPTATTGDATQNNYDYWLYRYNCDAVKWQIIANNQLPPSEIVVGEVDLSPNGQVNSIKFANNGVVSITGKEATITLPAGGAGGTGSVQLPVTGVQLSGLGAATAAVIDSSLNNRALVFESSLDQCVIWDFTLPADYNGTPVWRYWYVEDVSNAAHTVRFNVSVMRLLTTAPNIETDSYDTAVSCIDNAGPTTLQLLDTELGTTCALTSMDGAVANNAIKLKVCHDQSDSMPSGRIRLVRSRLDYAK
jgi:Repeat of unknown function (DUF5907)